MPLRWSLQQLRESARRHGRAFGLGSNTELRFEIAKFAGSVVSFTHAHKERSGLTLSEYAGQAYRIGRAPSGRDADGLSTS